jgi:hypothetical protein
VYVRGVVPAQQPGDACRKVRLRSVGEALPPHRRLFATRRISGIRWPTRLRSRRPDVRGAAPHSSAGGRARATSANRAGRIWSSGSRTRDWPAAAGDHETSGGWEAEGRARSASEQDVPSAILRVRLTAVLTTCGSGGTADALASGASPSNRVGVQIPASAPIDSTNLQPGPDKRWEFRLARLWENAGPRFPSKCSCGISRITNHARCAALFEKSAVFFRLILHRREPK